MDNIVIDTKTIQAIQLLSDDININIDPENLIYLDVASPALINGGVQGDYDVTFAKIIIKNADKKLKIALPWGKEDSSEEAVKLAYDCIMAKNQTGISIQVNDNWRSYYFPWEVQEFIPAKKGENYPWIGDYFFNEEFCYNGYTPNARMNVSEENSSLVLIFE
jgi:hypothetical protein